MLSPIRQRSLEKVKHIVLDRLAGHPAHVYLFGSCARGDAHLLSDIDIAIEPLEPLSPTVISDIREDLEESTVPYLVDVVDMSEVRPEFRARIVRDGIVWKS